MPSPDDTRALPGHPAVSVVVPTYREAANLAPLAERVERALVPIGIAWELIFADDDSDDGSEDIVAALASHLPVRITVRRDPPRDLSRSVLFGISQARFDRIVVMDADLSHPPERIPELLDALGRGCDIALGSRYAPGGHIDKGWSAWRFVASRAATWLARPLVECADPMSGFFALDRRALPDARTLRPAGYKIALELMVRGRLRVVEVPIDFRDRDRGVSKMGARQQLQYLRHLARLYAFRHAGPVRLACFAAVGASGFVIDVACYLALEAIGVEHRVARLCAFWPAVTWNWLLNRRVTFRERRADPRVGQWARFVTGSLVGLVVNVGTYAALTSFTALFDRHRLLALVTGVALGGFVNFALATLYVYRRDERSAPAPAREAGR